MQTINEDLQILGRLSAKQIVGELSEQTKEQVIESVRAIILSQTDAINELGRRVDELQAQLGEVRTENAALTEKINKNIIL